MLKKCNMCHQDLSLAFFSKDKATKDGLANRCSPCKKTIRDKKQNRSGKKNIANIIDANNWLDKNYPNYKVLKWNKGDKSTILDKKRNVEFEYVFYRFKDKLKQDPNRTFNPTKKELSGKIRSTFKEKHGTECALQVEEFKKKMDNTIKNRYGVENVMNLDESKQKICQTNLKKYGVENPQQNKEINQKTKDTIREKYGVEHPMQNKDIAQRSGMNSTKTKIKKGTIKVFEGKTVKDWAKEKRCSVSYVQKSWKKDGPEKMKYFNPKRSKLQQEVALFLNAIGVSYIEDKRLKCREYDFLIEDKKLIIECDGLFYHSDHPSAKASKSKKYHVEKLNHYENNGYTALFFRQDEILNKFPIIKSIILNKLGRSQRVFARKTKIKEVSSKKARDFYNNNHLMGNGTGRTYGLYFDNKLICAIQVRWRRKKEKILDVSRFCCEYGYNVVGGFSKLIKHVVKKEDPAKIETFIDRRYGQGLYLSSLGFVKENEDISFSWTDGHRCYHRMNFRGNTGYEYGLRKIWDCGQAKWSLFLNQKGKNNE